MKKLGIVLIWLVCIVLVGGLVVNLGHDFLGANDRKEILRVTAERDWWKQVAETGAIAGSPAEYTISRNGIILNATVFVLKGADRVLVVPNDNKHNFGTPYYLSPDMRYRLYEVKK